MTPPEIPRPRKRILIVDDEPMVASAVRIPLVRAGYDVEVVGSGEEALELLRTDVPDLIVLDVVMPGLSGFEVCRRLREQEPTRHTPVIFLTSRGRVQDMIEGRDAGSDIYLVKPVLTARLLSTVSMFLSTEMPLTRKRTADPGQGT